MGICEACSKKTAVHHVTVTVEIFGPERTVLKLVQFMVCDDCRVAIGQVMAKDPQQRQRVAWRFTAEPQLFSKFRDMRERRFASRAPITGDETSSTKNHEVHAIPTPRAMLPENAAD